MAKAARVLRKTNADVVALQETTPAWERSLRKRLGDLYPVQRYRHAESGGPALRLVRKRALRSALAQFDKNTPTWHWNTSYYTFRSRLDHVFFSKHLRCVGAQVLEDAASDHYPVEAVFNLSTAPSL